MALQNIRRHREWFRPWSFIGLLRGSIGHGWFAVRIGRYYIILKNREVHLLFLSQTDCNGWRRLFDGKRWWCGVRTG